MLLWELKRDNFFRWSQIYSTLQKGHKENPEKVNGDCYSYDLNGGQANSRIRILTVDQKSASVLNVMFCTSTVEIRIPDTWLNFGCTWILIHLHITPEFKCMFTNCITAYRCHLINGLEWMPFDYRNLHHWANKCTLVVFRCPLYLISCHKYF